MPSSHRGFDLKAILSVQEPRVVTNDYTIRYHGQVLQIRRRSVTAGLRGGKVTVEQRLDGSVRRPAKDHPWRQRFKRSVLSGGKPDISTLR